MALGMPVAELIEQVGHDGSEIVFPEKTPPADRRGFHTQEMIRVALDVGMTATPIELFPRFCSDKAGGNSFIVYLGKDGEANWDYFEKFIVCGKGVMEGSTDYGHNHAVAFQSNTIYDPDGEEYSYSRKILEKRGFPPFPTLEYPTCLTSCTI